MRILLLIAAAVLIISANSACSNDSGKKEKNGTTQLKSENLTLPGKYSILLRKEMLLVESNMKQLLSAIVKGEADKADSLAAAIHNGFILKQKLSRSELKELKNILPADFIKLDKQFHLNAAKISDLSRRKEFDKAMNIYNEMTRSCVQCHSHFAQKRFPGLQAE